MHHRRFRHHVGRPRLPATEIRKETEDGEVDDDNAAAAEDDDDGDDDDERRNEVDFFDFHIAHSAKGGAGRSFRKETEKVKLSNISKKYIQKTFWRRDFSSNDTSSKRHFVHTPLSYTEPLISHKLDRLMIAKLFQLFVVKGYCHIAADVVYCELQLRASRGQTNVYRGIG